MSTTGASPNYGRISDSIAGWIAQLFSPLYVFWRVPFKFTFQSNLRAPSSLVWKHAASAQGINEELGPFVSMRFPRTAPLPEALRRIKARKQSSHNAVVASRAAALADPFDARALDLDALLSLAGEEEVDGLISTESTPLPLLFACNLLLFGILPIDRHELGFESVWKERRDKPEGAAAASDDEQEEEVVAGFDELSQSILQQRWVHRRCVMHVPADAIAESAAAASSSSSSSSPSASSASSSFSSYTRVTDELEVTPRNCWVLLFPLIWVAVWLVFRWRHFRLRSKFGLYDGLQAPPPPSTLKTVSSNDVFRALVPRPEDLVESPQPAFVPAGAAATSTTTAAAAKSSSSSFFSALSGLSAPVASTSPPLGGEFELVSSPNDEQGNMTIDARKKQ